MKAGKASLQPLDPFHDIDPMVELDDEGIDFNLREVESQLVNGCFYKNEDSDESSNESESEYVPADDFERNMFDAILDDEDNFFILFLALYKEHFKSYTRLYSIIF